jgi:cell division protein FtsW
MIFSNNRGNSTKNRNSSRISNKRHYQSTINPDTSNSVMRGHRPDFAFVIIPMLLMILGLIVVYSISPGLAASEGVSTEHFIYKQLISVGLGVAAFAFVSMVPTEFFFRSRKILAGLALGASILLVFIGENINGAVRWIDLPGGFSFQVAELIKLAIIIGVSYELGRRMKEGSTHDMHRTFKPLLILFALIALFVAFLQSDLGSAAVMTTIILAQIIAAGMPLKKIAQVMLVVVVIGVLAIAVTPYRRERVKTFINPSKDCLTQNEESLGRSYQTCQALIAIGSGGLFGLGIGNSVQAYGYLPEAENDSIFAIIGEKFGFVGLTIIMLIYLALFNRFKKTIELLRSDEYRLIVVGVFAWLGAQAILNIGAMAGILPLKGITLPLVSSGGTSLLFIMIGLGLVFRVSRYTSFRSSGQ